MEGNAGNTVDDAGWLFLVRGIVSIRRRSHGASRLVVILRVVDVVIVIAVVAIDKGRMKRQTRSESSRGKTSTSKGSSNTNTTASGCC